MNSGKRARAATEPTVPKSAVTLPETGFVRLPAVLALFPISESGWWAGIKSGRYPRGVKLGPRTTAWRVEDIRALIEQHSQAPAAA